LLQGICELTQILSLFPRCRYIESLELRVKRLTDLVSRVSSFSSPPFYLLRLSRREEKEEGADSPVASFAQLDPSLDLEEELGGPLILDLATFTARHPAIKPKGDNRPSSPSSSLFARSTQTRSRGTFPSFDPSSQNLHAPCAEGTIFNPLPTPEPLPFTPPSSKVGTSGGASVDGVSSGLRSLSAGPSRRESQTREPSVVSEAETRQRGKDETEDHFVCDLISRVKPEEAHIKVRSSFQNTVKG
jgi:hypothetical protein